MKKTNKDPLVSVVIPTYSSIRTIEKCLQSIKKQTYKNIDIIVVDSLYYNPEMQKKCKEIITRYARYFQDGPERSIQRNRGIKEAKGEYIAMIDQDMYLTENVISEAVSTIRKGDFIALNIPEISIGEGYWTKCVALERYISTYLESGMNECCRFYSKENALAINGYDPTIVGVEDSDFHYRLAKTGKIGKIKNFIYHDEGKTKFFNRVKKKYYYSRAFKEYVKRYPAIATAQFFPFKSAYVKHVDLFLKHPLITPGIVLLRGAEVFAGALGIMLS